MNRNYNLDLFVNLSKYKPTENVTPLENFTTELFVYILKDLLQKKSKAGFEICNLFGIKDIDEVKSISTQKEYSVDNKKLKPDITIELGKRTIFIEVKVDSPLHPSILKRNLNDQLEDYQQIVIPGRKVTVYSLTKQRIFSSVKNNVRWHKVSSILSNIKEKNQIIDNFIHFLEINNMGKQIALTEETKNVIKTFNSFFSFLEEIYNNSKFRDNGKYKLAKKYFDEKDFGFPIMDASERRSTNDDNWFYWFGIVDPYSQDLSFEVCQHCLMNECNDETYWEKKDWKKDHVGYHPIISSIKLNKILKYDDNYDEQIKIGTKWLNKIYDTLTDIVKKKYL